MRTRAFLFALLLGAVPLSGCATVKQMRQYSRETDTERAQRRAGERAADAAPSRKSEREARAATAGLLALPDKPVPGQLYRGNLPPPSGVVSAAPLPEVPVEPGGSPVPPGMQYLYGSGEAAAVSLQAYLALNDWMIAKATARRTGETVSSVVLAPGATPAAPRYLPCDGDKPLAVVLDIDETSLLNLGYEADDAVRGTGFDAARWAEWERTGAASVAAVPGAAEARAVAGATGVTFVYNSNRSAASATQTAAALDRAGLGPAVHGSTLWLQGDVGGGSGKDARRAAIAEKFCVIALVGDQLGDFSDQFNAPGLAPAARRALASSKSLKTVWRHGWFMLPNPVYGPALKGGLDDVFPADRRWTPPK